MKKRAIILLSGGLDSATTLFLAKNKGLDCYCLAFDYGQRHNREIESAKKIARAAKCPLQVVKIRLPWKGSSLLDKKIKLKAHSPTCPERKRGKHKAQIPATYVPARNIIFLSFALSYAEAIGAEKVFIGANAIDYSGYPDCRPGFYKSFSIAAKKGTKSGVEGKPIKIETPLINKTKAQIVRLGKSLGVPFAFTWSCYKGGKKPCGGCDSCKLREKGFREAGMYDEA